MQNGTRLKIYQQYKDKQNRIVTCVTVDFTSGWALRVNLMSQIREAKENGRGIR